MAEPEDRNSADPLGLEAGRLDVLKELVAAAEGLDAESSDFDLDAWWGTVEIDRMASGLTLTAVARLSEPDQGDGLGGAWIEKPDPEGNEPTQLTDNGKAAVRQELTARG